MLDKIGAVLAILALCAVVTGLVVTFAVRGPHNTPGPRTPDCFEVGINPGAEVVDCRP